MGQDKNKNKKVTAGSNAVTVILIAAGVLIYAISGGARANFGIIIQPLTDSSGISYATLSFILGISQLMYGVTQPLWGMLALKRSNSVVLLCGIPLMSGGLLISALTHSSILMFISLGLMIGSGGGALCFGMIMGAISPVLGPKRAAAASGILNAGSGIGGAALSPTIQMISAGAGISIALIILAAPFIVLIPIVLWIRKKEAAAYSETSDADDSNSEKASSVSLLKEAVSTADYRRLMAGFSTCGFHMIITQTHMVPYFTSLGISEARAAIIYTAYGVFTMVGAVVSGLLCTRFHLKNVLGSLYGARVMAVALFLFASPKNAATILLFALIMGMTGEATVTPTSEIISRRFGARAMGFLFGITFVCHQIGAFISSWLGGIFIDNLGNYNLIWMIDIGLCALASFVSFRIGTHDGE